MTKIRQKGPVSHSPSQLQAVGHGLRGDFQLEQRGVDLLEHVLCPIHGGLVEKGIGPLGEDDGVRSAVQDGDDGDARPRLGSLLKMIAVDPVLRQRCPQLLAEIVASDAADHVDAGAEARAGQSLIGSFPSPGHAERATQKRLAQMRLARRPNNQIHIQRANDCNGGHTKSPFQLDVFNLVMIPYL